MSRTKYPRYQPSKVPWITQVPSHWTTSPFSAVFSQSRNKNTSLSETNLLSLSFGRIIRKDILTSDGLLPESFETYQIIEQNDLVFRFTDLQNDKRSLRSAITRERGIITSAYLAATPYGVNPDFASYLMRAYDTVKVFYSMGGGLRQSLKFDDVKRLPVLVPPLKEQRAIADYLDRETAQIDALISKQEALIETLRERRDSVAVYALSGKLRASANQTDSTIQWLGKIPNSWKLVRARFLCTITTGDRDSNEAVEDGSYPFYVRGRTILRIDDYAFDGDAVMTPGDGQGGVGKVFHFAQGKFNAHQRVYVFHKFDGVIPQYFYFYLSTFLPRVALSGGNKVTMESLRRPMVAGMQIALPPIEEQHEIAAYIDEQTTKIDLLIKKAQQFVELAKERRAALITAAVTGQIDVRGEAA